MALNVHTANIAKSTTTTATTTTAAVRDGASELSQSASPLLHVENLHVDFPLSGGAIRKAVNGVSFDVPQGSVTCLVGESGSGKSVTAMSTINLVDEPGIISDGRIVFDGQDVLGLKRKDLMRLRGEGISMIFQEPMHSLDPVLTIGKQMIETIRTHQGISKNEAWKQSVEWIGRVGLPDPEQVMDMYPHELSGGMVQRAMIAIALSCHPKMLVADEPTTALDVTIQAQIIELLLSLKEQIGLSILFITHDFGVVAEVADHVVVMYEGKVVEQGDVYDIFDHPQHPYTKALLETRPVIGRHIDRLPTVKDLAPQFSALSDGTQFQKEQQQDELIEQGISDAADATGTGDVTNTNNAADAGNATDGNEAQDATQYTNALHAGIANTNVASSDRVSVAANDMSAKSDALSSDARNDGVLNGSTESLDIPTEPLLQVEHLKKYFVSNFGFFGRTVHTVRGVNDVSFSIQPGETVGLVGESGSGKTTLGQTILRLQGKTDGVVRFQGRDVFDIPQKDLRVLRPKMQYIFQDPYSSLNPRIPIADTIGEPMVEHGLADKMDMRDRVVDVLKLCGMDEDALDRYPHEFSGGQRQRIGIARAMGLHPDFVVADEPVASLDVSIQAQIINLFSDLKEQRHTSFLFISHDLSVVEHLCSRIIIMYLGVVVETGSREELFNNPIHPYTKELLEAIPVPNPRRRHSVGSVSSGDPAARRPYAQAIRDGLVPKLHEINANHWVAWPQE